ncbi:uncharacterized protein LOC119725414, partial [Patiria miniata]|uniref:Death domain-containing protein n=1 Tax=Patiria miniata TaxID=46514 RepID=A0A913ZLV2_PATMI
KSTLTCKTCFSDSFFIRCHLTQKPRTLCFQLDPETSVWCLKLILNEIISVHPQQQRLFIRRNFRNFELCNLLTLHDYGIQQDENISLRLCTDGLLGGGPKAEISELTLSDVAGKLGHDWKDLAIHLGFTSADISTFEADNPGNVNHHTFQMLVAWRNRQPTIGGQMDVLCAALARIDRNDIVSFLQGRHKKSEQPVGSQPADDAGTSTRPSTSQIPQTSGVTSREEVGTQPADDAGTSTRPSTSPIPQTSRVTSREEVGTQPADDAGTSTTPSTSPIAQISGVTSREEAVYESDPPNIWSYVKGGGWHSVC